MAPPSPEDHAPGSAEGRDRGSPVVVHCFRGWDPASRREVHLSPELAFLEARAAFLPAGRTVFVESPFPEVGALGELPAGYVGSRRASAELLCHLFRQQRPAPEAGGGPEPADGLQADAAEVRAWAAHVEGVASRVVDLTLWAHAPCYKGHTRPAMLSGVGGAGAGAAARLLLAAHCRRCRHRAQCRLRERPPAQTLADFESLLAALEGHLGNSPFLHGLEPRLDDLVLFAHAQVLLDVPRQHAPWPAEAAGLERLRRFTSELGKLLAARRSAAPAAAGPPLRWEFPVVSMDNFVQARRTGLRQGPVGDSAQRPKEHEEGEKADKSQSMATLSLWRTNGLFIAWWIASMAGFAFWRHRRLLAARSS